VSYTPQTTTLEDTVPQPGKDRAYRRALAGSLLLHLAVIGVLFLLPGLPLPVEEVEIPLVMLVPGDGAAGSAGGQAGGGSPPSSAPASETSAKPPPIAQTTPAPAPVALPRPPRARPQPRPETPAVSPAMKESVPVAPSPALAPAPQPGTAATGASTSGPGGAVGTGQGDTGAGAGAFGSGEGPGDDYFERLRRHLAKHKRYPPEASRQKQEGRVHVEFTLARDGTVLAARIERGSGYPLLDQAVLDMLERASPVPPLPERFTGERIQITMPIGFSLGFFTRIF
jgi:periplasmic protein TonB